MDAAGSGANAERALAVANAARLGASDLRARVRRAGRDRGAELVIETIERGESPQRFHWLLRALPLIGQKRSASMLAHAGINPLARVDSPRITERQRRRLIDEVLAYAHRRP